MLSQISVACSQARGVPKSRLLAAGSSQCRPQQAPEVKRGALYGTGVTGNWLRFSKAFSGLHIRRYTVEATNLDGQLSKEALEAAEEEKYRDMRVKRFKSRVNRFGNPKPELERLIDDFSVNFLQFVDLKSIVHTFDSPVKTNELLDRYKRPLKPLEYYFSESQLQQIFMDRLSLELSSEVPNKAEILTHIQSEAFLQEMQQKFGFEGAEARQNAFLQYIRKFTDDELNLRPLTTIDNLLETHPLSETPINGPLDEELLKLRREGKLKDGEITTFYDALKDPQNVPLPTEAENMSAQILEELDKLELFMTPEPDPSASLPYYERLRMQGKSLNTSKRRMHGGIATRSTPEKTIIPQINFPAVYPFTSRSAHLGNGIYANPIEYSTALQAEKDALAEGAPLTPQVRQWTASQRLSLKKFIDYTNEWLLANKMLEGTLDESKSSGIDWTERRRPELAPEEALRALHHIQPSSEGVPLDSTHETLRILAQTQLQSTEISSLLLLDSTQPAAASADLDHLYEEALAVAQKYGTKNLHVPATKPYNADSVRALSASLSKNLRRKFSLQPPRDLTHFDLVAPGQPRTSNYSVETNLLDEAAGTMDPATHRVRTPLRPLLEAELNAYHKLGWLTLKQVAESPVEPLLVAFVQGSTGPLKLETLWEARKSAQHLVSATESLYSTLSVSAAELESVASKVTVDFAHLHSFIVDNMVLLGEIDSSSTAVDNAISSTSPSESASLDTSTLSEELLASLEPKGKLTNELRETLLAHVNTRTMLAQTTPVQHDTFTVVHNHMLDELKEKGDVAVLDKPVWRRLAKMDPSVRELVETLTGPELRALFPLDVLHSHPFLTLEQRSRALIPVFLADPQLNPRPLSPDSHTLNITPARQSYLEKSFPMQILTLLRGKTIHEGKSALSSLGTSVERMSRLLDLPPIGLSISSGEVAQALNRAHETATPSESDALASLQASLADPAVQKLFRTTNEAGSLKEPSERLEKLLAEGIPSSIPIDSPVHKQLSAELQAYQHARSAAMAHEARHSRSIALIESIRTRLGPVRHLFPSRQLFMVEPNDADSFDALLLKQDLVARAEESLELDPFEQVISAMPKDVNDADIFVTKSDGTTEKKRFLRETHEEEEGKLQENPPQAPVPRSILFGSSEDQDEVKEAQREALESELNALRDLLGLSSKEHMSPSEARDVIKAFVATITGMDPLTMWEKYPDLAPQIPPQAIHGPFRETWDIVSPNVEHIPEKLKHMYEPMKDAMTRWYLDRDEETLLPRVTRPMDMSHDRPINMALGSNVRMEAWLSAYSVDLAFPVEKAKIFHEVLRMSPRMFRKMDMDRDLETLKAFNDTIDLLKMYETPMERIEWFKDFQRNISRLVDVVRALIGPHGESYLEYNNFVVKRWLQAHHDDLEGPVSADDIEFLAEAVLKSGELDHPDDRVLLQVIYVFLQLSLDATELFRLEQVTDVDEFESWVIWRISRRARHAERASLASPADEAELKNNELPFDHPQRRHEQDHLDEEEDALFRFRLADDLEFNARENTPPKIIPKHIGARSLTEYLASIARRKLPERRQALEDEKDQAFWQRKDHERILRKRAAEGFAVDSESRTKDIQAAIEAQIPQSKWYTADSASFSNTLKLIHAKLPEHIRLDPLYEKIAQSYLLKNEKLSKLASISIPMQDLPRYVDDIADTPAQSKRIMSLLHVYPIAQHAYHAHLKMLADLHFGKIETSKLASHSSTPAPEFDLEALIIKVLSSQSELDGVPDDILINPREIFPNAAWEPESSSSEPSLVSFDHHTTVESISTQISSQTNQTPTIPSNLSKIDQSLHESFYNTIIASIAPKSAKISMDDPKRMEEALATVKWATNLTALEHTNWTASYRLFAKATLLHRCVSKYSARIRAEKVVEIETDFMTDLQKVDFSAFPAFPQDLSSLKIIPWTLIQRLLGYSDRQLKTLLLFLTNKQHYLDHASSRPPKVNGFYWDISEFNMIRNRFLRIRSHPNGTPTFEETMHDLLFTDTVSTAPISNDTVSVVREEARNGILSPSSNPSLHHFKPIDAENVLSRFQAPKLTQTAEDRLIWAQEEAKRLPLDNYAKHTFGQLKLAELGLDLSEFHDDRVPGLEKLIPIQKHAFGDVPTLEGLEKLANLAPKEENDLALASDVPLPAHGAVKVQVLVYGPGDRIGEHREDIGTALATREERERKIGNRKETASAASTSTDGASADAPKNGNASESSSKSEDSASEEQEKSNDAKSDEKGEKADGIDEDAEAAEKKVDWLKMRQEAEAEAKLEAERAIAWEQTLLERFDEEGEENVVERLFQELRAPELNEEAANAEYLRQFHEIDAKALDSVHLTVRRRQLQRLIMTKWSLLYKQASQLDFADSFPAKMAALNIFRGAILNQLDISFWHSVPHKPMHRNELQRKVTESYIVSNKFHRRLMIQMDPLIWGTTHRTPQDSLDETFLGMTNIELYHARLSHRDEPVFFDSPLGRIAPRVEVVNIPDPEERDIWAAKREEVLGHIERLRIFSPMRRRILAGLLAAALLGGSAYTVYSFATQEEDTLPERILIETSILETQAFAAADRIGYAASFAAQSVIYLVKGVAWLFTYSMDRVSPLRAFMDDDETENGETAGVPLSHATSDLQPLVPAHLVRQETGGYHYRKFIQHKTKQERLAEQALLREAYELYERLPTDPVLQAQLKQTKDRIQDAIRLAQLQQYEKQKHDFAKAIPREPQLPTMPDWFEMPENRFWDQVPNLRYYAPDAEKFWRRSNWYYHPDDEPVSRMLTPNEHLFGKDARITSEGHVMNPGPNPWHPRPVDDL